MNSKRILSLLLAFVMMFGLLPVAAFAAEAPNTSTETPRDEQDVMTLGTPVKFSMEAEGSKSYTFTPSESGMYTLTHSGGFTAGVRADYGSLTQQIGCQRGLVMNLEAGETYTLTFYNLYLNPNSGSAVINKANETLLAEGETVGATLGAGKVDVYHVILDRSRTVEFELGLPEGVDPNMFGMVLYNAMYNYSDNLYPEQNGNGASFFGYMEENAEYWVLLYQFQDVAVDYTLTLKEPPKPEAIRLDDDFLVMEINGFEETWINFNPEDAYEPFTVTVGDPSIVKLEYYDDHHIELVGLAAGSTTVTVTTESGLTDTMDVMVVDPEKATQLNPGDSVTTTLKRQEAVSLRCEAEEDGVYVLCVSADLGITGGYWLWDEWLDGCSYYYIPMEAGEAITYTLYNAYEDKPVTFTSSLVKARAAETVKIKGDSNMMVGESHYVLVEFGDPLVWDEIEEVTSSNPTVADVYMDGFNGMVINAYSLGSATITVTMAGGAVGTFDLQVTETGMEELKLGQELEIYYPDGEMVDVAYIPAESGYYAFTLNMPEEGWINIQSDYYYITGQYVEPYGTQKVYAWLEGGVTYYITTATATSYNTVYGSLLVEKTNHYVSDLEIVKVPDRLEYVEGHVDEAIAFDGLEVKVTWADGGTEYYSFDETGRAIGEYSFDWLYDEETNLVYVVCCEGYDTYSVNLIPNPVASIELINEDEIPAMIYGAYYSHSFYQYQPHPILKQAKFLVTFTDGTTKVMTYDDEVAGYPFMMGGDVTEEILFVLLGATDTYTPVFVESDVASIEILSQPDDLVLGQNEQVWKDGDRMFFTNIWNGAFEGLRFRIHYVDGTYVDVNHSDLYFPDFQSEWLSIPEYEKYPVEAMYYLPEYGQAPDQLEYWTGSTMVEDGQKVPMMLHYKGAVAHFEVTIREAQQAAKEGWQQENGSWYFYKNGQKLTGWQKLDGKWYYLGSDGAMQTGWVKVSGKWYYLDNDMKTGWVEDGGKWYYMNANGVMQTGWVKISGKWYFFNSDMKTGWVKDGGKWYYMDADGVMQTGWVKVSGKWYYMNSDMKTGWQQIGGKWYYMDGNGVMQTGWEKIDGKWYFFSAGGVMQRGWRQINGNWYFLYNDMKTGWVNTSGNWYYLDESGIMVHSCTLEIDGETYTFDENGIWVP